MSSGLRRLAGVTSNFFFGGFERRKHIMGLLLLGIALRVCLSFFTSHPNDEEVWYIAAINMLSGQGSPYGTWYFSYPPVWAYISLPFVSAASLFSNPYLLYVRMSTDGIVVPVLAPLFNFFIKLPIIIADVLVALVIFQFVGKVRDMKAAREAFIFWFFNPLVIFSGAVVAQFDVFPALTSLLAFVFLFQRKYVWSGVSLSIAVMTKVYPVLLMPLFLAFLIKPDPDHMLKLKRIINRLTFFVAGALAAGGLLLLPIILSDSFRYFFEGIFRRTNYVTSIGGPTPLDVLWLFVDANQWSNEYGRPQAIYATLSVLQLIGIALIIIYLLFRSRSRSPLESILEGHIYVLVLIYLTSTTVNPQYIIWIVPFLVLGYGLFGNYRLRLAVLSAAACFLAFYWAYPLHPITAFFNREIGLMLNDTLNFSLNPSLFTLGVFFGLLGVCAILLLPFPRLSIVGIKTQLNRLVRNGNPTE